MRGLSDSTFSVSFRWAGHVAPCTLILGPRGRLGGMIATLLVSSHLYGDKSEGSSLDHEPADRVSTLQLMLRLTLIIHESYGFDPSWWVRWATGRNGRYCP